MKLAALLLAFAAAFLVAHRAFELGLWPALYCVGTGTGFGIVILLVCIPENRRRVF